MLLRILVHQISGVALVIGLNIWEACIWRLPADVRNKCVLYFWPVNVYRKNNSWDMQKTTPLYNLAVVIKGCQGITTYLSTWQVLVTGRGRPAGYCVSDLSKATIISSSKLCNSRIHLMVHLTSKQLLIICLFAGDRFCKKWYEKYIVHCPHNCNKNLTLPRTLQTLPWKR